MENKSVAELEAGVERLLTAYGTLKEENRQLRKQLSVMGEREDLFRQRLDRLLEKLAEVDLK